MNIIPAYPAPDFKGIENWNDGSSHNIKDFKGRTILLDFWTYTCIYCLRTIPTINEISKKYKENDLVIISIHSAEYEFAKDITNIKNAISGLNLNNYLTGFDIYNQTWESYGNSYWPKHVLIDKDGLIRYEHPGYGVIQEFEEAISDLLDLPYSKSNDDERKEKITKEEEEENEITKIYGMHFAGMAPEICVGYSRLRRFGNDQKIKMNDFNIIPEPKTILDNNVYLRGKWRWDKEGIKSSTDYKEKDPAIIFKYNTATNVNIIVGSDDSKPAYAEIKLDGEYLSDDNKGYHVKKKNGKSIIETTWPFINNIVKTKSREIHKVEIIPRTDNFYFYTFVFG